MIYKQRSAPGQLIGLHALLQRLPATHPAYGKIQNDLYNAKAGFGGEKEFDYQLREFKPDYPHAILHDLYLKHGDFYFQIDSLLITPFAIVLFEIKNIAGKLHIKQNPTQFIRESASGERTVLKSPIEELERKKFHLSGWLNQRNLQVPLLDYTVFAYHNELTIENMEAHRIVFSYEVPNKLRSMQMNENCLTERQIGQLAGWLTAAHREFRPKPLLQRYMLDPSELIPGVRCTNCGQLSMQWRLRTWRCQSCGYAESAAHLSALKDWYCIKGDQLTNRQFRYFCRLPSRHVAKRLLANPYTMLHGKKRYSSYHVSSKILLLPDERDK